MARDAGVDFAAAGWSHRVAEIEQYMRANATAYCASIDDLRALIIAHSRRSLERPRH
jgi:hypothetical protein